MPCWQIRTTSVEFGKKTDLGILADAIRTEGGRVFNQTESGFGFRLGSATGTVQAGGHMDVTGTLDRGKLKSAYSKQAVRSVMGNRRWNVQLGKKTSSGQQFVVSKRA